MKKNKVKKQEKEQMEKKEEEQQPQKKKRNWAQIVCWSSLSFYWIVGAALSIYSDSAYSDRWHRIINYSKGSSNDVIDNILLYVYQYPKRLLFFIFLLFKQSWLFFGNRQESYGSLYFILSPDQPCF